MEKNIRITNAEIFEKDGQMYVRYFITKNGVERTFERPYHDAKGNVDPEVANILAIARKNSGNTSKEESKNEVMPSGETKPVPVVSNVQVYNAPKEKAKVQRDYKAIIASGLAGLLIGLTIMGVVRGCSKDKNIVHDTDVTDQIEETNDFEEKITYMTEEEYFNGSKELCNYLNTLGYNYKLTDVNAFYYSANMDIISDELFTKLISEGYIPNTDDEIIEDTFAVVSDIETNAGQTGKLNIDFNKVYLDKEMVKTSEYFKEQYNKIASSSIEETRAIVTDLEDYIFVSPERGYNTLPVGGRFIFNSINADLIGIGAGLNGVSTSQALLDEITDISAYVNCLGGNLNCVSINDTEKQLVK